ncbi:MAG: hypothetical protein A3G23_04180 [Bacteroidetes bacterium RIFCSPLOWO2_12_FULL_37_12]|nr:MAG: hypothetical protein A3G23_04180 [Bacteroidetes bacterium RIFCSPLOWO2_12_FULL_37_12]
MNKFFIVIPTKDKEDTLYWTLQTCLDQDYTNYEIIISDDSTSENTGNMVKKFNNPKIRYFKTTMHLSLAGNLENGINQVTEDGFVIFIGDDDALLQNGLSILNKVLNDTGLYAIGWKLHKYFWPSHVKKSMRNRGMICLDSNYRIFNSKQKLKSVAQTLDYTQLPCIYHGAIHTNIIKQKKRKAKTFIHCLSPDVYTGIVACCETSHYIYSNFPFSITGHSQKSTGTSSYQATPEQKRIWNEYLKSSIPFHPTLEPCPGTAVTVTDAFLKIKQFYPFVPNVDLKDTIYKSYDTYLNMDEPENAKAIKEALIKIATKNNLSPYLEKLFKNIPSDYKVPNPNEHYEKGGYKEDHNELCFDFTGTGIDNVYNFNQFIRKLIPNEIEECSINPIQSNWKKYIYRFFISGIHKIKKKLF